MEYRKKDVAAGLFVLIALLLLAVMVAFSSNVQELFKEKKNIAVRFIGAEGVQINTPVKQAGGLVGKVDSIEIKTFGNINKIVITLRIRKEAIVKKDSRISIKSPLVGEKYVEIGLGSPDSPMLGENDIIDGVESLSLDQMTDTVVKVIEDLQYIVGDIKKVTGDPEFQQSIKNTIVNLERATTEINKIVDQNAGNIGSALGDLKRIASQFDSTARQLNKISGDVNTMLAENRANIHSTIQNLRDTPDQLMAEVNALQQAVTTPLVENREDLKKIIENLEKITQNLVEMTDDLKNNPSKLIRK